MKDIALEIEIKRGNEEDYTWQYVNLSDASLTLELTGVIMNEDEGGTQTYPFTIDVEENPLVFGSSAELRGESIYSVLHDARCRLSARGLPILQGKIDLDDSVDISIDEKTGHHKVEVKAVSKNKSYQDLIGDAKLRDLLIGTGENDNSNRKDEWVRIPIGYCLPTEARVIGKIARRITKVSKTDPTDTDSYDEYVDLDSYISLPHYLFPKYTDKVFNGKYTDDFTNVSEPYDPSNPLAHPFCNVRMCYQKYKQKGDDWEKERGYSIGEPDRMNSAPCFYLGFVFDIAMAQMGIPVTSNALNNILDYKRMAFWHADAQYDTELVEAGSATLAGDEETGDSYNYPAVDITDAFSSCAENNFYIGISGNVSQEWEAMPTTNIHLTFDPNDVKWQRYKDNSDANYNYSYAHLKRNYYSETYGRYITSWAALVFDLHKAYANADNLPDISVEDLIADITKGFGARVIYDSYMESISITLLRDVMRDSANAITVPGEFTSEPYKTENNHKGFRLKYSSANTQSFNSITKAKNDSQGSDETSYNYYGYKNIVSLKSGEKYESFSDLVMEVSANDMHLYNDETTGNFYRVKVDSDAKTQGEWYPSVFEVAGYRDVELGDCDDDDFVTEVEIPFSPAIASLTNQKDIRETRNSGDDNTPSPKYAQFVDGEIHTPDDGTLVSHTFTYEDLVFDRFSIGAESNYAEFGGTCGIKVQSFEEWGDATDGPYYDNECGNTLGIMRGGGSDATLAIYDENFDGFGTAKYVQTAGSDAEFFPDCVNNMGQMFDYNGMGKTIDNVSKLMAANYIHLYYGCSNPDLTSSSRRASNYYNLRTSSYTDSNKKVHYFIYSPVTDNGGSWSDSTIADYITELQTKLAKSDNDKTIYELDKSGYGIVIHEYDTEKEANTMKQFLSELGGVYYGTAKSGSVFFPLIDNGLGYDPDQVISLKLKAEKPVLGDESTGEYYPVQSTFAKRGLWDKFYVDWAHFWLDHHIANFTYMVELASFVQIAHDTTKWYTFGEYTGLLKSATAELLDNGKVAMKVQLAYI